MGGKPKRPVLTAAEEIRAATAEAHGVLRDLRTELRNGIRLLAELHDLAGRAALEHADVLNDELQKACTVLADRMNLGLAHVQEQARKVTDHTGRLLGAEDSRALSKQIVSEAARSLAAQLMITATADGIVLRRRPEADQVDLDEGGDLKDYLRRETATGRVFVVTDPADAPPGTVILDAR